jgi:hypothetical protein
VHVIVATIKALWTTETVEDNGECCSGQQKCGTLGSEVFIQNDEASGMSD